MLFVGTSIIHPSTEGVFLLCNILDLLIYSWKKSVDLMPEIMNSAKWRKFKENQESQKNDRPTFVIKWLQKREKFDLIECENSGNADVVPYL